MSIVERDQLLGAIGADPDHHQQTHFVLLQADLEVDPVDPHVDVVGARQDRLLNATASSCHCAVSRVIDAADRPALEPRNCSSAGPKSPLDRPCRYSNGSTSATFGDFRAQAGRIAEANRRRSPVVSSIRLSLTRGARTGIAPAAVVTSRGSW
jgi:hypothetical protein